MKGLYDRGLSRKDIRELFRVIDWMIVLPEGLGKLFWSEMQQYEQETRAAVKRGVKRAVPAACKTGWPWAWNSSSAPGASAC